MVDYNGRLSRVYATGRRMPPEEVRRWTTAFAAHVPAERPLRVLDLGSGIGRLTPGLAVEFGGPVYGVEPADRMREVAEQTAAHPAVTYLAGRAEDIPLPDASIDAVLMFLSFHHFSDRPSGLREVCRVLRPGGVALLRSQFSDLMPNLFWYDYFPSARAIDASMYPSLAEAKELATRAGLRAADDVVNMTVETQRTMQESYERMSARAFSLFELLPAAEIDAGFERFAADVERDPDRPVPVHPAVTLLLTRPR